MNILPQEDGAAIELRDGSLLPIRHIVCIGRNYAEHAAEMGSAVPQRPMVFFKSPASVALHGDPIVVPRCCQDPATGGEQVDFEAELAVVIGEAARDVSRERALGHVLGYCCGNDVSARWWQKTGSGGQFCRGKSFDTFCPLGPRVTPASEVPDPQALRIVCRVNGETMQDDSTAGMIFTVAELISELSKGTTLPAGTVVMTGSPPGVGFARSPQVFLKEGDRVEVEIERLGVLENHVIVETPAM